MRKLAKRLGLGALCAATLALGAGAAPVQAATDPLFVLIPSPPAKPPIVPPPTGYLNGPCGIGVDSTGRLYVSDYYHHAIDVFNGQSYFTQLPNVDPLGGPCGLAFDAGNGLYVNNYHRNVVKYGPLPAFGAGSVFPLPAEDTVHHLPTGVAVNTESNTVYVNNRTYISAFDSVGNPVMDGPEPLKIGLGTLGDGYGLAVSQFPGTFGRLYVLDASTNTVKVYDPTADKVNPVAEIKDPFGKPFVSLRDSAVAVDWVSGDVYFADNTQPKHTERPRATIYIYSSTAIYKGHLKYDVVDALPPGLAVDNSDEENPGNVYVTSGNTTQAGVYAYGPGSGTFGAPQPPTFSLGVSTAGTGSGSVTSLVAKLDCESACERDLLAGGEAPLTASAAPGSTFTGWSGACSGTDPTCTVEMDQAASVRAGFAAAPAAETSAGQYSAAPAPQGSSAPAKARHRRKAHHRHRKARQRQRARQRRRARQQRHRIASRRQPLLHRAAPIASEERNR